MKKLFLHIGYHRTGTTYLQSFLFHNRIALAKNGILYPSAGLLGEGHAALALCLPSMRDQKIGAMRRTAGIEIPTEATLNHSANEHFENLREELLQTDCESAVISSECFLEWLDKDALYRQVKKLPVQLEIVVFIRRQDRWIESVYNQVIKDPELVFGGEFNQLPQLDMLDFESELNRWANCFGDDQLHLHLYQENQGNLDAVGKLLSIAGLDSNQLSLDSLKKPAYKTNSSLDECCIEVLRQCNALGFTNRPVQLLMDRLSSRFRDAGSYSRWRLPKRKADQLVKHYQSSNHRLFSRFGITVNQDWGKLCPQQKPPDENLSNKFSEIFCSLGAVLDSDSIDKLKKHVLDPK